MQVAADQDVVSFLQCDNPTVPTPSGSRRLDGPAQSVQKFVGIGHLLNHNQVFRLVD